MEARAFDLQRFVDAQAPVYARAVAELRAGRKRSHWMWFIFPQIRGLGYSATARRFAIRSLAEARAYLQHPLLGPRLEECTRLVLAVPGSSVGEIFGYPDDLKFRSCMTLFCVTEKESAKQSGVFQQALEKYFAGEPDEATLGELRAQ
ncbi:MAG: DUF1810 domain-containing protein [Acidobacteria bacterium]|nr:DUF1810 domain-containing protein [Acidobacteriota bacterium]